MLISVARAGTGRDNAEMGMMGHRRALWRQDAGETDADAEMPGIDRDGGVRRGRGPELLATP